MGKLYLNPLVKISKTAENIYISDDDVYKMDYFDDLYNVLLKLKSGCDSMQISEILGKETATDLIESLKEMNLIKSSNENLYKNTSVERQVEYLYSLVDDGNEAQKKIEMSTIAIIGVGGVGSIALQHLVAAGFKHYILIDGDTVNYDNFNRQLIYSYNQIGMPKVEAAKEYIMKHSSGVSVEIYDRFIGSILDLQILNGKHIDFMICGADKPYMRIQGIISEFCKIWNIPSTYGVVGINCGNWGPIICPNKDRTYYEYQTAVESKMNCDEKNVYSIEDKEPLSASFGITNTIVATHMVFDLVKYIIGAEIDTGVIYSINFNNMKISKESIND